MSPAKKPDHSSHGQTQDTKHNTWTKDTKTKTAKCEQCGHKVEDYSWQCSLCRRRLCSKCCEGHPDKKESHIRAAKDMLKHGCWCQFSSNVHPNFRKFQSQPDKHLDQRAKDAVAKKKSMKTLEKKKAEREGADESPLKPSVDREPSPSDGEFVPSEYEEAPRPAALRKQTGHLQHDAEGSEVVDLTAEAGPSSKRVRRGVVEEGGEEYGEDGEVLSGGQRQQIGQTKAGDGAKQSGKPSYTITAAFAHPWPSSKNKRSSGAAGLSSDGSKAKPSQKTKKAKPSPLEGGHTVIVGAGIVGLFTAYELASRCKADGGKHKVTVIDIRDKGCELASGQCAGFVTCREIRNDAGWRPFLVEAQKVWIELTKQGKSANFGFLSDKIDERHDMFSAELASESTDDEGVSMPNWFNPKGIYHVELDKDGIGRIDPWKLAIWLQGECDDMDVSFRYGRRPEQVQQTEDGSGYCLTISEPQDGADPRQIVCTHLVFAAGPFTTWIVGHLFFGGGLTPGLENDYSEHLWMEVPLGFKAKEAAAVGRKHKADIREAAEDAERGLTVATTTNDNWSSGTMIMAAHPGSDILYIAAAPQAAVDAKVDSQVAFNDPPRDRMPLLNLAQDYLSIDGRRPSVEELSSLRSAGAIVSVAKGGHPCLRELWLPGEQGGHSVKLSNVWLSYGYGRFGTTLAPGAARILVEKMM